MSPEFQRAQLLIQQGRFELAEVELHKSLLENPNDPFAHSMLAHCYANLAKYDDAERETEQSIALAPDSGFVHYIRALVLLRRNKFKEAEQSAREAIRLDPTDADYYQSLASALLAQRKWQDALDAATEGLAHDPEHVNCMNSRTMALTNLGRKDDAILNVDQTLANDPDNTMAHTNKGWALLHQRNPKLAIEHFREALRLDPENDYAKSGMVEAIKAQNFVYRWILSYFLWIARQDARLQWGLVIGGYFGQRFLGRLADDHPDWTWWIYPVMITYVAFVLLTWFAVPLSNLMLRLNRNGRYALSRDQTVASNWLAFCIVLALGGIATYFMSNGEFSQLRAVIWSIVWFGMAFPLVTIYNCDAGWPRKMMTLFTIAMALLGVYAWVVAGIFHRQGGLNVLAIFGYGFLATPWIANILTSMTVRK